MQNKSIKKNMLMSVILTSANFIFPLITYSYVARVLTPIGTGRVTFVYSMLTYFSYVAVLGIPAYGLREVAKVRDNRIQLSAIVQELLTINILSTILAYFLLVPAVLIIPKLYTERILFLVMGSYIFLNTIGLEWVYQGLEEYSYITIRSIVFKIISVVLTFILIKTKDDVAYYGFLHIFTSSASYIMNFIHIRKYVKFNFKSKIDIKKHLRPIFTLFAASIIISIYANFDVVMIGFIRNDYEVGLYNSAYKIKLIVLSLSTAVTTVLVPRMAYYLKDKNTELVFDLIEKSLRVSLILAVPFAFFIFVYPKECILFLCGEEYLPAVSTLRVLILTILPLILTNLFGNQILIPSGNEKRYSQSVFIGMWINLSLNSILILKYGTFGAALATLITECWNVIWMGLGVKQYVKPVFVKINVLLYSIPLIIAFALTFIISKVLVTSVFWTLFIYGGIFFVTYYAFLFMFKEPIVYGQIKSIFNKIQKVS